MAFKWTDKRELFCIEYLACNLNATCAAIKAGYAEKNARKEACRLMSYPEVQDRIAELKTQRSERTRIDADWLLQRLQDMADADVADLFTDDHQLKPLSEWPSIWRKMVTGIEAVELFDGRGDEREQSGYLKKIKTMRTEKLYEMIGKHVGVQAFKERIEHDATEGFADALRKARERAKAES